MLINLRKSPSEVPHWCNFCSMIKLRDGNRFQNFHTFNCTADFVQFSPLCIYQIYLRLDILHFVHFRGSTFTLFPHKNSLLKAVFSYNIPLLTIFSSFLISCFHHWLNSLINVLESVIICKILCFIRSVTDGRKKCQDG